MKHLKTFESYVENPIFFRFSKTNILGDQQSAEISPRMNEYMVGDPRFIQILSNFGFPNLMNCIHFMDKITFDQGSFYKNLYGDYTYKVIIDDNSNLGWSFMTPVHDWWYKSNPYNHLKREKDSVKELDMTGYGKVNFEQSTDNEVEDEIKKLVDFGFIGSGHLSDLMSSNLWGKEKVFIWCSDKVKIQNI